MKHRGFWRQYWGLVIVIVIPLFKNDNSLSLVARISQLGVNKIWKVLHYNVKRNSGPDFWKFRTRVAKAAEKVGGLSLHVWAGSLGGPSGHVLVGYGNADMSGIDNESETWPKVIEAYKEIFGEDSFDIDQEAFNNSLEMWGNFSEVWRWLPELSSPAVSIN